MHPGIGLCFTSASYLYEFMYKLVWLSLDKTIYVCNFVVSVYSSK